MSCQALYDFDGTLTSRDTTAILVIELVKLRPWRCVGAAWFLLRMIFARESKTAQDNKNKAIGYLIRNLDDEKIRRALRFFRAKVESLYRPAVLASIDQAIRDSCTVLVVTASPTFAVQGCLPHQSILVLGTEFEKRGHVYTGRLESNNCYGLEKVNRINAWAASNNLTLNVQSAWSDHFSDFDMLSMSVKRYWVGDEKLRMHLMTVDPDAKFIHVDQTC